MVDVSSFSGSLLSTLLKNEAYLDAEAQSGSRSTIHYGSSYSITHLDAASSSQICYMRELCTSWLVMVMIAK